VPIVANGHGARDTYPAPIRIALMNNMPDVVLEDTESQFIDLLNAASGDIPVHVELFSLPNDSRSGRIQSRLSQFYQGLDTLWNTRFDALIITGTEPRHRDLRQEPYWPSLVEVLNWAQENTASTILSCLAAHAAVLHSDGIARNPLDCKQFGVFSYEAVRKHTLTRGLGDVITIPHSRWNQVQSQALISCGYTMLTESPTDGADLFVKHRKNSLFVHFQGHPEYRSDTLLKEYRRDVKRFLKQTRETYPSMPEGYLDRAAADQLSAFRRRALISRGEQVMSAFPEDVVRQNLRNPWRPSAIAIYRNWLQYLEANSNHTLDSSVSLLDCM